MRALPAVLALTALTLAAAAPGDAQTPDAPGRVSVWLHGGFVPGASDFSATQTFTEFAEKGRIDAQYHQDPGPVFEIGLGFRLRRRLGLTAAGSFGRRDGTGSFTATLPHPLYFGAFRPASGDFRGTSQREKALHLDLALLGGSSRLQWSAFAGPSLIGVRAELAQRVEYTQAYPFDTVTVTGTTLTPTSDHAFGFNVGAGLDWQAARHIAIGAQLRFSRATVSLEPTADDHFEIDAGGVALTGGLRLDF